MFAFTVCFLNIFFKAAIVFRVLLNWQSSFRLLCSLIFVAGFCFDCVKCCAIGWVSIFPMWKSSGRAFAAATVRCRGRGYIALQSCKFRRKALRVTPRGKHWLTVYRAPQVCVVVWPRTNFFTFVRARRIRKCIRCVHVCVLWKFPCEEIFFMTPTFSKTRKLHE